MKNLLRQSLPLLLSLLLLTSCEKDAENCFTTRTIDATLVWTGDYALDGCGYILYIGKTEHKPVNEQDIADSYKSSAPTAVEATIIDYDKNVRTCMSGVEMNSIKVVSLRAL